MAETKKVVEQPDAEKHQMVSFIKSAIRITGCVWAAIAVYFGMTSGAIFALALMMGVAELVGVYEELV